MNTNIFTLLLVGPLTNGLVLFYRILGSNLGLAIIAFSILLRYLLNPLTKPYMESMKKMKELAPQLAKLKEKHKGDKIKLTQAQAEFYKQRGINPGAGCLPYLLQIVILIALFNVFSTALSSSDGIKERLNGLLYSPLKFSAEEEIKTKFLYMDMTKPDVFRIPQIPTPLPGPILILSVLVQIASAKISAPYVEAGKKIAKKTPGTSDDMQSAMQQSMMFTFPLFTLFIGMKFASGLALYWFLFSLFQAVSQYKSSGWGGLLPVVNKLKAVFSRSGLLKSKT